MRPTRLHPWVFLAVLALAAAVAAPSSAQRLPGMPGQAAAPEAAPEPETVETLAARRAELAKEIDSLREISDEADEGRQAARLARIDLLERIDRTLARRSTVLERLSSMANEPERLAELLGTGPPYPLALLDAAGMSLEAHRTEREAVEKRRDRARRDVERRVAELEERERFRRETRDASEKTTDALEKTRLEATLKRARLESRLAEERLALARGEAELATRELEERERAIEVVRATLERIRAGLELTRFDLDEPLQRLALEEEAARRALERAQAELAAEDRRLEAVRSRVDAAGGATNGLAAELEARRARRQAAQWKVAIHDERIRQIGVLRETWKRRFEALSRRADEATVRQWQGELEERIDELRRQMKVAETRAADLARDLEALRSTPAEEAAAEFREARIAALDDLAGLYTRGQEQLAGQSRDLGRALADLRAVTRTPEPSASPGELVKRVRSVLGREVVVVDDRSITLGKLIGAVLLFMMAFSLSRGIARLLGRFVFSRLSAPGAAFAFERLTFYGLLVLFILVALRLVSIPLTAFALLGGALAIGLGFGSQNVISNFIGGLILLMERPMKVGDIVDVDGVSGIVERVGPRSTRIRTFDNLHIIVPNTSFLEQNVINWTLSDRTVRRNINVGVAYGSDPRETTRLIKRAVEEHGKVLKNPAPQVFFADFGDNALVFKVFFWIQLQPNASLWEVDSDLRHRIHSLLSEAKITIAFPQRDVHLDTVRPIEVRVMSGEDGPTGS